MLKTNKYSPSPIVNLDDIDKEILILKARVKAREEDLSIRLKQAPSEAVKVGTAAIIPSFLQRAMPFGLGNFLKIGLSLFRNKKKGIPLKNQLFSNARKIGTFAILKSIFSFFLNRRKAKQQKALRRNK